MAQKELIKFTCDEEGCDAEYIVDISEEGTAAVDETAWPTGWVMVKSKAVGLTGSISKTYCTKHRDTLIRALGFESYQNYVSVVKGKEEETRSQLKSLISGASVGQLSPSPGENDSEPN